MMIKLFRNTRKKFLAEGKTSRYLESFKCEKLGNISVKNKAKPLTIYEVIE